MIYTNLSTTSTRVSKICLGTMSFGAHVDEATAFDIMDRSLELGINFFDTAELYSIPWSDKTYGLTEEIIGRWMGSRQNRKDIVLATKVVGPRELAIRSGKSRLDKKNITQALEESLKRLQTDVIDLYQLHWPDRTVPKFGERNFVLDDDKETVEIEETLSVLQKLQQDGKVKHIGISNETPWGTCEFLRLAKEKKLPRAVSIQNNYSLLTRSFEVAMSEVSLREDIGLLAYSPLGYGVLGGRYLNGAQPQGGRFTTYPDFVPRYRAPRAEEIIKKYKILAESHDMTLPQLALAFVYQQPFVRSTIIGPASVEQLEDCVKALGIVLSAEILAEIENIHEELPNFCA